MPSPYLLVLSLLTFGAPPAPPDAPPAEAFKQVAAWLSEARTAIAPEERGDSEYNLADVNEVLSHARADVLARIPKDDAPLRHYVEMAFPQSLPITGPALVPRRDAEPRLDSAQTLIDDLRRLPSFRVDLTFITVPAGARVDLIPAVGPPLSTPTNGRLTNVYRGVYEYVVTKGGFKRITGSLRLIDSTGDTMRCTLQAESAPDEPLLCAFGE